MRKEFAAFVTGLILVLLALPIRATFAATVSFNESDKTVSEQFFRDASPVENIDLLNPSLASVENQLRFSGHLINLIVIFDGKSAKALSLMERFVSLNAELRIARTQDQSIGSATESQITDLLKQSLGDLKFVGAKLENEQVQLNSNVAILRGSLKAKASALTSDLRAAAQTEIDILVARQQYLQNLLRDVATASKYVLAITKEAQRINLF